jgi:hypothetical protein
VWFVNVVGKRAGLPVRVVSRRGIYFIFILLLLLFILFYLPVRVVG